MFNKLKAIKDVRSQAKQIEKALEGVTSTGSAKGLTITINGKQEVIDVQVADTFDVKYIAAAIKGAMNEAMKKIQKDAQKAIQDAGGMPDLSSIGM